MTDPDIIRQRKAIIHWKDVCLMSLSTLQHERKKKFQIEDRL